MKKGTKVKAFVDGKYVEGKVEHIEAALGFKRTYPYNKVTVIFPDKTTKEFRDFDLIVVDKEK